MITWKWIIKQPEFKLPIICFSILFILGLLFFCIGKVFGFEDNKIPINLWKGLIAEAVSEGELGMRAVACVVHNRLNKGMNSGLVALKRKDLDKFVWKQGKKYEIQAKKIIQDIFYHSGSDITNGATHYENIEKYGKPYWVKNMIKTCKIGKHTFYKENK